MKTLNANSALLAFMLKQTMLRNIEHSYEII